MKIIGILLIIFGLMGGIMATSEIGGAGFLVPVMPVSLGIILILRKNHTKDQRLKAWSVALIITGVALTILGIVENNAIRTDPNTFRLYGPNPPSPGTLPIVLGIMMFATGVILQVAKYLKPLNNPLATALCACGAEMPTGSSFCAKCGNEKK